MHKLQANVDVGQQELSELRLILERQIGILFDTTTEELTRALSEELGSQPVASAGLLLERLRTSDAECEHLAELLLDDQTRFFRYPLALQSLASLALPELEKRKPEHPRSLRILSAGCSTGEEAYSIGISVCEVVNCNGGGWNVNIVASDIRRRALEIAERGLYPPAALKDIPSHLVQPYFAKVGDHLLVKPRLRNLVRFAPMNLAKPPFLGQFDCIFCMDVLPRFSTSQRTTLVQRLHLYLEPGGYLFLGQNEKLPASEVKFQNLVRDGYTVYQKAIALAAKSGR
ncbi:MAG: protein-glutamate O-methyltransferase CheR [Terriglobales bacterium]